MFENMVCGVANVGERKYRILAVFIIAVMVSMSAFLMPVQVYAAGEAISVLVGTLAGLITESVIGSELVAAGCAALIPEFAGAFIAVAIGLGVTVGVYTLYQCFESWWGTSGNVSDFKMIAEAFDKQNNRIIASPFIFASICSIIKNNILGLKTSESSDVSVPTFTGMEHLSSTIWSTASHSNTYEQTFNLSNSKFVDGYLISWANTGNRITHYAKLSSGNITLNFEAPQILDVNLRAESTFDYPLVDISLNHYSPIFTSSKAQIATSFKQVCDKNDIREFHDVQNLKVKSCSYISPENETVTIALSDYDAKTKMFYVPYTLGAHASGLILKDGTLVTTFDSDLDFAYKFLYKAAYYVDYRVNWQRIDWQHPLTTTALPLPSIKDISESYSKSRDVISTTADDINKKIKTGDVTKDTAGSISIGIAPTAVGKLTNTSTAQDVEKVKITDVALPTQVEADKTAKEEAKIDPPGNIGAAFRQGGDMIIDGAMTISDKFPFDVIKCAYEWLQCLIQDGKPIVTEFTINIPKIGSVPVKIDFSERQDVVTVINWICIVGCALGIILTSREWLKAI